MNVAMGGQKNPGVSLVPPKKKARRAVKVLALTRHKMQSKAAMQAADLDRGAVMCHLLKAEQLPSRRVGPAQKRKFIDPYVTFSIARGNPLTQEPGVEQRVMRSRNKDRKAQRNRAVKKGQEDLVGKCWVALRHVLIHFVATS
eukprot:Skav208881  [mRNA]  locus=scaffold270:190095:196784:- [translate_table: standard]